MNLLSYFIFTTSLTIFAEAIPVSQSSQRQILSTKYTDCMNSVIQQIVESYRDYHGKDDTLKQLDWLSEHKPRAHRALIKDLFLQCGVAEDSQYSAENNIKVNKEIISYDVVFLPPYDFKKAPNKRLCDQQKKSDKYFCKNIERINKLLANWNEDYGLCSDCKDNV